MFGGIAHNIYGSAPVFGRTCDYLGVCVSYVAALKLRNYSSTESESATRVEAEVRIIKEDRPLIEEMQHHGRTSSVIVGTGCATFDVFCK